MAFKMNPPGTPLPANHPFKGARIIFGQKRPDSSTKPSTPAEPPAPSKTEEDDGGRHMMDRVIQNFQFAARSKGLKLGPLSANQILDMAAKGELKGMEESVEMVRGWAAKLRN